MCGDDNCVDPDENCEACPEDCGECPFDCGDTFCAEGAGETCENCPDDCGVCPLICGDELCVGGETCDIALGDPNNDYCYDPCTSMTCDPSTPCDVVCDANGCRGECASAADCYLDPNLCADMAIVVLSG